MRISNNKTIKSPLLILSVILFTFNIFFSYIAFIQSDMILLFAGFIMLVFWYLSMEKEIIKFSSNNFLWVICAITFCVSAFYAVDLYKSLKYSAIFFLVIILKTILENSSQWIKYYEKYLLLFSSVHVTATILYLLFPDMIRILCVRILTSSNLAVNYSLISQNSNPGITGQTATNAMFITYCVAVLFCSFVVSGSSLNRSRILNLVFLIISVLALFVTQKRGVLIANIVAVAMLLFLFMNAKSVRLKKYGIRIFIVVIIGCVILLQSPIAHGVIDKFYLTLQQGDLLTGRTYIINEATRYFSLSPAFGVGVWSMDSYIGSGVHNIYIQLLAENGIVGFTVFMFAFGHSLISTLCFIRSGLNNKKLTTENIRVLILALYFQIIFLTTGIIDNTLYDFRSLVPYILSIALVFSIKNSIMSQKHD